MSVPANHIRVRSYDDVKTLAEFSKYINYFKLNIDWLERDYDRVVQNVDSMNERYQRFPWNPDYIVVTIYYRKSNSRYSYVDSRRVWSNIAYKSPEDFIRAFEWTKWHKKYMELYWNIANTLEEVQPNLYLF